MRTTVAKRHTKALSVTDGNVDAELAGGSEHSQRQQVGGADHESLAGVHLLDEGFVFVNAAVSGGVLATC